MDINLNEVITFNNDEKYLVLAKTLYNNHNYYYLIEVSEDGEDVKDKVRILKEEKEEDKVVLVELDNNDDLEEIKQLLSKSLEENNFEE